MTNFTLQHKSKGFQATDLGRFAGGWENADGITICFQNAELHIDDKALADALWRAFEFDEKGNIIRLKSTSIK